MKFMVYPEPFSKLEFHPKKRFDSETLPIIKECIFRSLHMTDPIQGLGFTLGPTT
jgi:hypothetical protein